MSRFLIAAVSLTLLAGCATQPNMATIECPACGYEHEVNIDTFEEQQ